MADATRESTLTHRAAVLRFVRRMVRDEALAEDLVQESFLRAQQSDSMPHAKASERSWLCSIALNLVRDHFRAAARRPAPVPDPAVLDRLPAAHDTERSAAAAEMSACIGEFVMGLPHPQCDVVALHDSAGLTHPEIASVLGISTANSRVLLHRGRTALREILKKNCVINFDDGVPCERRSPGCK